MYEKDILIIEYALFKLVKRINIIILCQVGSTGNPLFFSLVPLRKKSRFDIKKMTTISYELHTVNDVNGTTYNIMCIALLIN